MDYRVILSRPALRDLGEISRYIAQDNPSAAERAGLELDRVQRV
jgi:plasmid stabilization system protein ParE